MQNLKMFLSKSAATDAPDPAPELDMLSPEAFKREVEREIFRSDRCGTPLTLLNFDVRAVCRSEEERHSCLIALCQAVAKCSRRTDSRGWIEEDGQRRVGLLLHNTVGENALRLIQTVRNCLADQMVATMPDGWPKEVSCEVFVYPTEEAIYDDQPQNGSGRHAYQEEEGQAQAQFTSTRRRMTELVCRPLPGWKRAVDIAGAGMGLLVLSPLFGAIALGIKLTSPGPVFFKQERIGHLGKPFLFWKFRTMKHRYNPQEHKAHLEKLIVQGASDAPMQKLDKVNPAITPLGRLLRISSLDELPQLINVLRGEMSLIGPRPCLRYEAEKYQCWHRRRFDVVPGMTGLWQVNGKNRTTFKEMIRYDIEYARCCSFWLDLKILMKTFPAIWEEVRQGLSPRPVAEVHNVR